MPLDREHMTVASALMLPTYVGLFTVLGVNYLLTPEERLDKSPALAYAGAVMNLHAWALLFLTAGVLLLTALATKNRTLGRYALWMGMVCMIVWAVIFMVAAFRSTASPSAWAWPAFGARAMWASIRSVTKGERGR